MMKDSRNGQENLNLRGHEAYIRVSRIILATDN